MTLVSRLRKRYTTRNLVLSHGQHHVIWYICISSFVSHVVISHCHTQSGVEWVKNKWFENATSIAVAPVKSFVKIWPRLRQFSLKLKHELCQLSLKHPGNLHVTHMHVGDCRADLRCLISRFVAWTHNCWFPMVRATHFVIANLSVFETCINEHGR